MIVNTFEAKCSGCERVRPRCAVCNVLGVYGDGTPATRAVTLCGPCRAKLPRGYCTLHPRHKDKDWTPPAGEHDWFEYRGLPCCKRCGVVKVKIGFNGPCRGNTKVTTRPTG